MTRTVLGRSLTPFGPLLARETLRLDCGHLLERMIYRDEVGPTPAVVDCRLCGPAAAR